MDYKLFTQQNKCVVVQGGAYCILIRCPPRHSLWTTAWKFSLR